MSGPAIGTADIAGIEVTAAVATRRDWDAIVVGAGASGGIAALLLARAGLRTLLLDAGWTPPVSRAPLRGTLAGALAFTARHAPTARLPWPLAGGARRALGLVGRLRQPVQRRCYAWALDPSAFVDDRDMPFVVEPGAPFDWIRGLGVGGRLVVRGHGRQYARMTAEDLAGWPLDLDALIPWYEAVEALIGLSPPAALPDDPALAALGARMAARWPRLAVGRARAAPPLPAVALAAATGRLALRRGAVAQAVLADADGQARGVRWFDRADGAPAEARAGLVVLAASALESARILMLSHSPAHPEGIGAAGGALGRYLMDHVMVGGSGTGPPVDGAPGPIVPGRCLHASRMDRRDAAAPEACAGYDMQAYLWQERADRAGFVATSFAPMAPRAENRAVLDPARRDAFGAPVLRIACRIGEAEQAAARLQSRAVAELAEAAGVRLARHDTAPAAPGAAVHECGVARMGAEPRGAVLDPFGACWDAPGLIVVDAAAFPSLGVAAPTLTAMALAARAVDRALRDRGVRDGARAGIAAPAAAPAMAGGDGQA